jgi:formylglycine-generating enzyme
LWFLFPGFESLPKFLFLFFNQCICLMKKSVPILFFVLLLTVHSYAQTKELDNALNLYKEGKTTEAFSSLKTLADNGNADAMNFVGRFYEDGLAGTKDPNSAFNWYSKAAQSGNPAGMYNLAYFYLRGIGTQKDSVQSTKWYLRSAQSGYTNAMVVVGLRYWDGYGITKNTKEAMAWFRRADERENVGGTFRIAEMYFRGFAPEGYNSDSSRKYYLKAANKGHAESMGQLGYLLQSEYSDTVNIKAAKYWLEKAIENGDKDSRTWLTGNPLFLYDLAAPVPMPDMVLVEGGSFQMGSTASVADEDEKPVHKVTVGSFYMAKNEVSLKEYTRFCIATNRVPTRDAFQKKYPQHDSLAVDEVSYRDAVAYCAWLSKATGRKFRLPTEAEWEYAAGGGKKSKGFLFSGSDDLSKVGYGQFIGDKKPNELGLYGMAGYVAEFCADYYDKEYYSYSPQDNPKGPLTGKTHVVRTGYDNIYSSREKDYRVANRASVEPGMKRDRFGFRVVMVD